MAIHQIPGEFLNKNSRLDQFVHMQHYKLPTRVMDVTSDYKVGLFFACYDEINDKAKDDGEVVVFYSKEEFYSRSDRGSLLAALSGLSFEDQERVYQLASSFTTWQNLKGDHSITTKKIGFAIDKILKSNMVFEYSKAVDEAMKAAKATDAAQKVKEIKKETLLAEKYFSAKRRLLHLEYIKIPRIEERRLTS